MIVSVHMPKTAGLTFRKRLEAVYGERLLHDYEDWMGGDDAEAQARREERAAEVRRLGPQIEARYDIVAGHFIADKYLSVFRDPRFVTFVRDPYQHAISLYEFMGRSNKVHPLIQQFQAERPGIVEFITRSPDIQSRFLGAVPITDFAMVGVFERFRLGMALFGAMFGKILPSEGRSWNRNPDRDGKYPVPPEVKQAVERHRAADLELHAKAKAAFAGEASRYGL